MELNIAFSTIFYIAVFILPGLIFRRIYFSGDHNKQFSQGNLVERIAWTIFSSVITLISAVIILYFIDDFFKLKILTEFNYSHLQSIFNQIADNKFPSKETLTDVYPTFIIGLLVFYIYCFLLAKLLRQIVLFFGFDRMFNFLRFNNYWYYYLQGRAPSFNRQSIKKFWASQVDVLVQISDSETKLYKGFVLDYFIDSATNQLDIIFLKEAQRFRNNKENNGVELVDIPGTALGIPFSKILNINLTYIYKDSNLSEARKQRVKRASGLLFLTLFALSIFLLFIEEWPLVGPIDIFYRILFFLNTFAFSSVLVTWFNNLANKGSGDGAGYALSLLLLQYTWIVGLLPWYIAIPGSFTAFYLIYVIKGDSKK
ncbi:hypothetical protein [Leeuwenhoekiella sp. MAR_2009_132]|uniref:hypothetical protein n=1 Tax=Leeuwenhoekiella sp. MAR_2009_132 TaxID=1392489 RepID=UPI00048E8C5F|nr:hypothetical protein [Leeuwenhoekiella sp. MAR_2009_132]